MTAEKRKPYEFDPNLGPNNSIENPNASNQYIANNFFHHDLYLPQQQWAEAHPTEYNSLVDYMIANNWTPIIKYNVKRIINTGISGTLISAVPYFKYPLDSNYVTLYPNLTILLKEYIPTLKTDTRLINTIHNLTNVSSTKIINGLTWGNGPQAQTPIGQPCN